MRELQGDAGPERPWRPRVDALPGSLFRRSGSPPQGGVGREPGADDALPRARTDYDGTLARDGHVDAATLKALRRLRTSGRRLILVTGREDSDLRKVCPHLDLFDRLVLENGAVLAGPATSGFALGKPPPAAFIERLRERGVAPLFRGKVIVSTLTPHVAVVSETLRELGLEHRVILNKGSLMVLPPGVDKASGLAAALADLHLSPHAVVGVGDAENDMAMLAHCGCAVAVANALASLKARADVVTAGARGAGVIEIIDRLLADDLAGVRSHRPLPGSVGTALGT